jgi:hypothetical protein
VIKTTLAGGKLRMAKATLRAPGRPPLDEDDPSVSVSISLPSKQFEALCKRAQHHDVSVPAIIRDDLETANKTLKTK